MGALTRLVWAKGTGVAHAGRRVPEKAVHPSGIERDIDSLSSVSITTACAFANAGM